MGFTDCTGRALSGRNTTFSETEKKRKEKKRKEKESVLQVQGQARLGVGEMAHMLKAVLSTCAVWFTTVGGDCAFIPGRPDLSNYTETILITRLFD